MAEDTKSDAQYNAAKWRGRYLILFFNCLMGFGTLFCKDMPSALQAYMQGEKTSNCTAGNATVNSTSCCEDCLGLGPDRYNQLYAAFSWTVAVLVLPSSIFVDKVGIRFSSILFNGFVVTGTVLLAVATITGIRGSVAMFPLLVLGRIFTAAGIGPIRICQDRVVAIWFKDRLAMAFGFVVMWYRLGGVLNFLLTANMAATFGITWALWAGALFCGLSFISSVCLAGFDRYGHSKCEVMNSGHATSTDRKLGLQDFKELKLAFWLISAMLCTHLSYVVSFIANITKYIEDKYGYDKTTAAYIGGAFYDVFVVLAPPLGFILDRYGCKAIAATLGSILNVVVLLTIILTSIYPLIYTIFLGIGGTVIAVSLWPSIAKVVPLKIVGTANGIATLAMQLLSGIVALAVGKIMGTTEEKDRSKQLDKWTMVFILLNVLPGLCLIFGIILNIVDRRQKTGLNKPKFRRDEFAVQTSDPEHEPLLSDKEPTNVQIKYTD